MTRRCRASCTQWRFLPSHLDVEQIAIGDMERLMTDENEMKLSFFFQWKQLKGSSATYRKLILALLEAKCEEDAAGVCKLVKRDSTVHHYIVPPKWSYRGKQQLV